MHRPRMVVMMLALLLVIPHLTPLVAQHSADSITSQFTVAGIPVILRRNNANNVVAANLYFLGGVRQTTWATAGIEPFLLSVSERGTQHYPKATIRRKVSLLGTETVVAPSSDWTMFGLRGTTQ